MAKKILSVEFEKEKFFRNVTKYMTLAGKETEQVIREAVAVATAAAQRHTPPLKRGQPSASIDKNDYTRKKIVFPDGRVKVKIRGKNKYFANEAAAVPYLRITYRGISRAGWFLRLQQAGIDMTAAMRTILNKSPAIQSKSGINAIDVKKSGDDTTATIINNVPQIEQYARIAEAQGYRSAAHAFNAGYKRLQDKLTGEL